jgi:hypothetical protein
MGFQHVSAKNVINEPNYNKQTREKKQNTTCGKTFVNFQHVNYKMTKPLLYSSC